MPSPRLLLLGVVLFGTACEPTVTPPNPTRMMVLLKDPDGVLRPNQVELTTLTRPAALEGTAGFLIGGARIEVDPNDPLIQNARTYEQLRDALVKDEGRPVKAEFFDQAGVLWPADFHTWNMATAYYHLERSAQYFRDTGAVPESALDKARIYYFPKVHFHDEGPDPMVDNAMWYSLVQSLFVLPFDALQTEPLSINAGVMTHEFAHRVFNRLVHRGAPVPAAINAWSSTVGSTPGLNVLDALEEGFADFHAVASSCRSRYGCDTRFMSTSFDTQVADSRDLAAPRCMSAALANALYTAGRDEFGGIGQQYAVGTLIASALWEAAEATGQRESLEQALLDAYSDENLSNPGLAQVLELTLPDQTAFTLGLAMSVVVSHISDPTLKLAACRSLADRLGLQFGSGYGQLMCPDNAVRGTSCEVIP